MSKDRIVWLSTLALAGLIAGVCIFDPGKSSVLPPCPFHALTGWYCPGCGSTRMLHHLVHGHPLLAFAQNPFAMILMPFLLYGLVRQLFSPDRAVFSRIPAVWIWTLAVSTVVFAVLRNLPFVPFSYLAPGGLTRFF